MQGIKSRGRKWSVSICSCSRDTAHVHYGNAIVHIALNDLRELGLAMQSIAEDAVSTNSLDRFDLKKGVVQ